MSYMSHALESEKWCKEASRVLKARLVREGVSYTQLVQRLNDSGAGETYASVANKLSRGTFSFAFYLQCVSVLEMPQFDNSPPQYEPRIAP